MSQNAVSLPCFGIRISDKGVTSDLHEAGDDVTEYNAAMDAIESMVLAHHCAGIDVSDPGYLEGIETAVAACANNL